MYVHRYLCDVLDEMRKCYETRNFCSILGLVEEAQSIGNRMEAKLYANKDYEEYLKDAKKILKQKKKLQKELDELEEKIEELKGKMPG